METPTSPTEIPPPAPKTGLFPQWDRERLAVWVLVLSGMALRLWYLWDFSGSPLFDQAPGADVGEYCRRAQQLTQGIVFPVSPDIHAPGYSVFLAALLKLGATVPVVRVVQIVLNFAAWLGLYWLLRLRRAPLKLRLGFLAIVMLLPVPVFGHIFRQSAGQ